jgi:hypothetical protein
MKYLKKRSETLRKTFEDIVIGNTFLNSIPIVSQFRKELKNGIVLN